MGLVTSNWRRAGSILERIVVIGFILYSFPLLPRSMIGAFPPGFESANGGRR